MRCDRAMQGAKLWITCAEQVHVLCTKTTRDSTIFRAYCRLSDH